jgi:hypothetical protein
MGYRMMTTPTDGYGPRRGLEGPFRYPNGQVLYYDPKEGKYWCPRTDFYLESDEVDLLKQQIFNALCHG